MKIIFMDYLWYWWQHFISRKNRGYVRKFPNQLNTHTFNEILESIQFFREHLLYFCPQTKVVKNATTANNYVVIQKEVTGETLSDIVPSYLSTDTLHLLNNLIDSFEKIFLQTWVKADAIGILKWESIHDARDWNPNITGISQILYYFRIKNIFDSTNIMIDEVWYPWFIDNTGDLSQYKWNSYVVRFLSNLYWRFIYWWYKKQISDILKKRA